MGRHCAYGKCNSDDRYKHKDYMKGVRFILFPQPGKDLEKAKRWAHLCGRENFTYKNITKYTYICNLHFKDPQGPTIENPDPVLAIRQKTEPKPRASSSRILMKKTAIENEKQDEVFFEMIMNMEAEMTPVSADTELNKGIQTDEKHETDANLQTDLSSFQVYEQGTQTILKSVTMATQTLTGEYAKVLFTSPAVIAPSLNNGVLSYSVLKETPTDFKYFCGLSIEQFNAVINLLGRENCSSLKYGNIGTKKSPKKKLTTKLSIEDKLMMTLIRIRRGFTESEIAYFYKTTQASVSRIISTWIQFLYLEFKRYSRIMFDCKSRRNIPRCYKPFKNLKVIIDCTEIFIETPGDFRQQGNTYSSYKSHNTVKFLVGINVFGGIAFISEGFEGSISDEEIVIKSGILDYLNPDDLVMADRGFEIADVLNSRNIKLMIPPFLNGRDKFTALEELQTKAIARSRIHVERTIGRIKNYRMFQYPVKINLLPMITQMFYIACFLVNFEKPFVS